MKPFTRKALTIGGLLLLVVLILALLPVHDGPYKRQHANQAVTVGKIRTINELQVTFASQQGRFTCNLGDLSAIYDKRYTLVREDGEYSGYKFSLRNCDSTSDNHRYRVVAVPREPGVTGFKAYCSDETGVIYYDDEGSGERCFQRKKPIT